jgi:hypothetical protein
MSYEKRIPEGTQTKPLRVFHNFSEAFVFQLLLMAQSEQSGRRVDIATALDRRLGLSLPVVSVPALPLTHNTLFLPMVTPPESALLSLHLTSRQTTLWRRRKR